MLSYDVVDVFAEGPFAGNQLAVVHGAQGLSHEQLLTLAREFNFSETTFPTPVSADRYRVRIFTPGGEIPFAGHPTLGTASVLRERGELGTDAAVQECGAGEIAVRFVEEGVELTAAPRDLLGPLDDAQVADVLAAIGLGPDDRDGDAWLAGTGLTFVHVPVRDEAVARAGIARTMPPLPSTGDPVGGINLYSVTGDLAPELHLHSRVFVPDLAVPEDPATGSAAAGLGMALRARGLAQTGTRYRIRQGLEMGRPSLLLGTVGESGISVAGEVHPIGRGEIRVPIA